MTGSAAERLSAALAGRYRIERELAAVLGAERFVSEIKTTAKLQHPHILPLLDSGHDQGAAGSARPHHRLR